MALIINGKVVNLGITSRESKFIKEKITWMRENLTEDGKNLILGWNERKRSGNPLRRVLKGFSQTRIESPQGYLISMHAMVNLFQDEGLVEVIYMRRPPAQDQGFAIDPKKEKEVFQGRMVINLDRQPDLAFFMYYCSPQCTGGPNSNGNNVFKVQHDEKEAFEKNYLIKMKVKAELYALSTQEEGGLSDTEVQVIASKLWGENGLPKINLLRSKLHGECSSKDTFRKKFVELAEEVIKKRIAGSGTSVPKAIIKVAEPEPEPDLPDDVAYPDEEPEELEEDAYFDDVDSLPEPEESYKEPDIKAYAARARAKPKGKRKGPARK